MKTTLPASAFFAFVFATLVAQPGRGQLYYDTNGATPGTSTSSTQNFTDSVWTIDPTGSLPTGVYVPGSDVIFSATDGVNVGTGAQSVTVTDTESADSFIFDNGTVTLFGSGSPNLSIGTALGLTPGITVDSNDGPTTFDSSLGTVTAAASQSWNNDSTQALNFNSALTSSGSTITFAGTGSGAVNLNGSISGTVNLDQESTTSVLELTSNNNNFSGTITADGGSVLLTNSLPNSNSVTLENGGMVEMDNTQGFAGWNNNITLGTGGGRIYAGNAATGGIDIVYGGVVTGGTGLTLEGGDFLPVSNVASDVGTLNVANGRLLAIGDGLFGNNAVVNVSSGAILDFQLNETLNNSITLASGSALENRNGSLTLTNVIFPTGTATVTLGADDVGGGSITLNGPAINLANGTTLTIVANAKEFYSEFTSTDQPPPVSTSDPNFNSVFDNFGVTQTAVHLEQKITGSGNLVITPEESPVINATTGDTVGFRLGFGSPILLDGANDYSGTTTIDGATVYAGASGFGTSSITLVSGPFNQPYFENVSQIELSGGTFSNSVTATVGTSVLNLLGGSSAETISGPILLNTDNSTLVVANSSASMLSVGNIHFNAVVGTSQHDVNFDENGSGAITLTGIYSSDAEDHSESAITLNFGEGGEGGTYDLASTADFTGMQTNNIRGVGALDLWSGTLNIETNNFAGQTIDLQNNPGAIHTVNLVGARSVDAFIFVNIGAGSWTLSQATADESTLSGGMQYFASTIDVNAVDGGRLVIAGDVGGFGIDSGITKTGAGTVVLANSTGDDYTIGGSVAADIQQGTLLVTNSAASAFGAVLSDGHGVNTGTVNIEAGARLGGTGNIAQQVILEDATSILTAGDPGQANLGIKPTIGTLTLNSLVANNGGTFQFKLNAAGDPPGSFANAGVDNDFIEVGTLSLDNNVTIDITTLNGFLDTGVVYTLMSGTSGAWTAGDNLTFTFNLPTGYALDTDGFVQGLGNGYLFAADDAALEVQFIAVPEPGSYALLVLGGVGLICASRYRIRKV